MVNVHKVQPSHQIVQPVKLLMVFLMLCLGFGMAQAHAKEQIAFVKNGVTVWKVPVPNSDMIGFKAQTVLDASMDAAFAAVIDIDHASEWLPNIKSIKALKNRLSGQGASQLHFIIDMPFPLTDRHLAVKSTFERDASNAVIITNTVDNSVQLKSDDGLVRITDYHGSWKLEPVQGGKTKITIDGYADPAGGIPSWVANMFVTQQPYDMLINMKSQVKKDRYKNFKIDF